MPYAELLEFNQPNPVRRPGFTRIRDQFDLNSIKSIEFEPKGKAGNAVFTFSDPERIMEFAGRWDYGPNNARRLGEMSKLGDQQVPIVEKYMSMGHESMIEMGDATFFIECSRVPSHELVRHRVASYQQESQRFTKYEDTPVTELFYEPPVDPIKIWDAVADDLSGGGDTTADEIISRHNYYSLYTYKLLREAGIAPQIARYVLPNGTLTRIIMKTNIREWRHIIRLRMDKSAQPEMQELMAQIYLQLNDVFPITMKGLDSGERGIR